MSDLYSWMRVNSTGPFQLAVSAPNGQMIIRDFSSAANGTVLTKTATGFEMMSPASGVLGSQFDAITVNVSGSSYAANATNFRAATSATAAFNGTTTTSAIMASSGNATITDATSADIIGCSNGTYTITGTSTTVRSALLLACSGGTISTNLTVPTSSLAAIACEGNQTFTAYSVSLRGAAMVACGPNNIVNTGGGTGLCIVASTSCDLGGSPNANNRFIAASSGSNIRDTGNIAIIATTTCGANAAHTNAAVIGATSLTTMQNNSINSGAVYGNSVLLTCDAAKKKDIVDDNADEGSQAFTNKIMALKPKKYRWLTDDASSALISGFTADNIQTAFPECVKTTWRNVRQTKQIWVDADGIEVAPGVTDRIAVSQVWADDKGVQYDRRDLDTDNRVGSDDPLPYAVVDTTSMMAVLVKCVRHLQIQLNAVASLADTLTGLQTQVNGKAASVHTHSVSDITGTLPVASGGTGKTTLASGRILTGNGTSSVNDSLVAPVGALVGTTDVQTLTNKTLGAGSSVPAQYVGAGIVNDTEFGYLDGATSNIQAQINTIKTRVNQISQNALINLAVLL